MPIGQARGVACSITALKGLGNELWQGVDPDDYVAKERESWDQ